MVNNLLIHIGYHKTASTWLQRELFTSKNQIFEPFSKKKSGISELGDYIIEKSITTNNCDHIVDKKIKSVVVNILKEKEKHREKQFVLSDENLSGNPIITDNRNKQIAVLLKQLFYDAKILIVIREQKSIINSLYFQYLSRGGLVGIEQFLIGDSKKQIYKLNPSHYNYDVVVSEYFNVFGKENVLVLPYEMLKDNPKYFISYIEKFLTIKIDYSEIVFSRFHNKGKNFFIEHRLRFINRFTKSSYFNNYSPLGTLPVKYFFTQVLRVASFLLPNYLDELTKKRVDRIIKVWAKDRYKNSNQRLNQMLEIDLEQYGYF